jgi:hypothetical protein
MSDQTQPHLPKADDAGGGVVKIEAKGDVTVSGDVAGRDVVKTTTQIGFSEAAVQRLVLTVGVLVFITAACFFASGVAAAGAALALAKSVNVSSQAADSMQAKLDALQALKPGETFQQTFTEEELNSYWQLVAGPQIGLTPGTGAVRLLPGHQILIAGRTRMTGNYRVAATFEPRLDSPGQTFKLDSAAVQVLPLGSTQWGWVPVPAAVLQPLAQNVNGLFPPGLAFASVTDSTEAGQPAMTVSGTVR